MPQNPNFNIFPSQLEEWEHTGMVIRRSKKHPRARQALVIANASLQVESPDKPRTDFVELAARLDAQILTWNDLDRSKLGSRARQRLGFTRIAAFVAVRRAPSVDRFWCLTEVEGLILAAVFKILRIQRGLYIIGIESISPACRLFIKYFKVWTHFSGILPSNYLQANILVEDFGVPSAKVHPLPYQVDTTFYHGRRQERKGRPLIISVGRESRDFPTLLSAVQGLDADVHIAADSLWARNNSSEYALRDLPSNVVVKALTKLELRAIYAESTLAVICLRETNYQHGVTALQEAMAMGLPVIVSRTKGQTDIVIDRNWDKTPNFADYLADDSIMKDNGVYVSVGNAAALRKGIELLLSDEAARERLGHQARIYAEKVLDIDLFVERCVAVSSGLVSGVNPGS